jgi:hypothetical protein
MHAKSCQTRLAQTPTDNYTGGRGKVNIDSSGKIISFPGQSKGAKVSVLLIDNFHSKNASATVSWRIR